MRKIGVLLAKDALAEWRSFERFSTLGLFAAAVLLTLNFSLPVGSSARPQAAAGFVWAAVLFAAILELRTSFESERRDGTLDGLRAAPIDHTSLFVAKALSSFVVVAVLGSVVVAVTAALFVGRLDGLAPAIGIVVLGTFGLVGWGTLFAAAASGTRAADVVLPVLLFPLLAPQTISCVRLLSSYLTGEPLADAATGFVLLGTFDLLSWGTSILLFDYVLEE
jgi:heme exporter protein B